MRARHAKRPASRPAARGAWHGAAALLLLAALCAAGARAQTVDANGNPVGSGGRRGRLGVERNLPAQIGASVMLLGKFDWEIDAVATANTGKPWSRCLDQLWRAAQRTNSTNINFVPTHHWLPPQYQRGVAAGVGQYCTMSGTNGANTCQSWSPELIVEFREAMTICFAEAFRMGLTISVRPHLDDASPEKGWRNGLAFKPSEPYAGYTYAQIMLEPLADALKAALAATRAERAWSFVGGARPKVYFSLQGEMGSTISKFPREWAALVDPLKARVGGDADVLVGIGINFTGLSKQAVNQGIPILAALFGTPVDLPPDPAGVKFLVEEKLSFIGISAYAPMTGPGFSVNEFENAAFNIKDDLGTMGIDLVSLIDNGQLELHYSEFGLGGAGRDSGRPAATVREVATFPFAGVDGNYEASRDPWRLGYLRSYLEEFYTKIAAWLATPGNKTHKVSKCFIWSHGSFDVLAVYPESTNAQGSYLNQDVMRTIIAHNSRVRAGLPPSMRGTVGIPVGGGGGGEEAPAVEAPVEPVGGDGTGIAPADNVVAAPPVDDAPRAPAPKPTPAPALPPPARPFVPAPAPAANNPFGWFG